MQRIYTYDEAGRLVRILGSNGDHVDEFSYDDRGRRTQIRRVPARPERKNRAFGLGAYFDAAAEGEMLVDGGTVETRYDEDHRPFEVRVLDDEGTVVFRMAYTYDTSGRLSVEKLTTENVPLPKEFRDHIPGEHREAALAQLKTQLTEMALRTGICGDAERRYTYDEQGHLIERRLVQGPIFEHMTWKYNDRGDASEWTRTAGGFPHPTGTMTEPPIESRREYEYDSYGNWTSRTESTRVGQKETTHTQVRNLTYYD